MTPFDINMLDPYIEQIDPNLCLVDGQKIPVLILISELWKSSPLALRFIGEIETRARLMLRTGDSYYDGGAWNWYTGRNAVFLLPDTERRLSIVTAAKVYRNVSPLFAGLFITTVAYRVIRSEYNNNNDTRALRILDHILREFEPLANDAIAEFDLRTGATTYDSFRTLVGTTRSSKRD